MITPALPMAMPERARICTKTWSVLRTCTVRTRPKQYVLHICCRTCTVLTGATSHSSQSTVDSRQHTSCRQDCSRSTPQQNLHRSRASRTVCWTVHQSQKDDTPERQPLQILFHGRMATKGPPTTRGRRSLPSRSSVLLYY